MRCNVLGVEDHRSPPFGSEHLHLVQRSASGADIQMPFRIDAVRTHRHGVRTHRHGVCTHRHGVRTHRAQTAIHVRPHLLSRPRSLVTLSHTLTSPVTLSHTLTHNVNVGPGVTPHTLSHSETAIPCAQTFSQGWGLREETMMSRRHYTLTLEPCILTRLHYTLTVHPYKLTLHPYTSCTLGSVLVCVSV